MSGRSERPSATVCTSSSKSQYASIPAVSTAFRSCICPQAPRTSDDRSAVARCAVSARTRSFVSARSWTWRASEP